MDAKADGVHPLPANSRDLSLDLMKGLLVLLMVGAHVIQFFPLGGNKAQIFSTYVNLTTFSGFMFVFGYVIQLAYFKKQMRVEVRRHKLVSHFFRAIAAYYISGIAFTLLVAKGNFNAMVDVLLFNKVPGYSEFLLSFAFIYLIILIFYNFFEKASNGSLLVLAIVSLLSTFFPYDIIKVPILGAFVGTTTFSCFPILQYFPFFILGIYLARCGKVFVFRIFLATLFGSVIFLFCIFVTGEQPSRFPPSLIWVLGASFFCLFVLPNLQRLLCGPVSMAKHSSKLSCDPFLHGPFTSYGICGKHRNENSKLPRHKQSRYFHNAMLGRL